MSRTRRPWGRFALRVGLSLAVLAVVATQIDVSRAREGLARLAPAWWAAALAGFLALHVVSALKWRFVVHVAGARIGARTAVRCHAAGLFGNLCLPSLIGGDVVRAGLAVPTTAEKGRLVVGSVLDRAADLLALLLLAALGLACAPQMPEGSPGGRVLWIAAAAFAACGLVGAAALAFLTRPRRLRRLPRKLARVLLELERALRTVRARPAAAGAAFLACVAIQALFVLLNAGLGGEVGLELSLPLWFLLWPLAKIAAMLPLSFGGLGVREAAFAAVVAPFASESLAVAQSLVWQSVIVVGGLLAGGFFAATRSVPHGAEPAAT